MAPMMYQSKDSSGGDDQSNLVEAYSKLSAAPPGTIRLVNRTDFYTAYGPDALYVATHHFKTQTVLKHYGRSGKTLPTCNLSPAVAQSFLREALTTRALRIEIYQPEKGAKSLQLIKSASPGNLGPVEELLFANSDMLQAPVILALFLRVKDNTKTVGVAFADTSVHEMGVAEFEDNDLFSNTESLLIQLGVKEIVLAGDDQTADYDAKKLRAMVERCSIVATDRKKSEFKGDNVEQDLNRLLRGKLAAAARPEYDLKVAMASTGALITYLGLMRDDANFGAYTIRHHDLSQYMRLDASALRALNLMPDPTGMGGSAKTMSVFGLLNRCKTSQGTRTLAQWLKQPLVNLHVIEERQDLVECLIERQDFREAVLATLKVMPDMHRISKRFQKGAANLEDVVRVYQALIHLPGLVATLEQGGFDHERWTGLIKEYWLDKLREHVAQLATLQEMVETTIDLDEANHHNYVIKHEFDEGLTEIRNQIDNVTEGLDEEHRRVADELGMSTDQKVLHFENHSLYKRCFRLTRKEAGAIKGKRGYIELNNQKAGMLFTTKQLKELNDDLAEFTKQYDRKQSSLVKEVIGIAASYCPVLETLNHVLANLDVVAALAVSALAAPVAYVKPQMKAMGQGSLELVEARHPCLEVQDGINFIPNDVKLERGVSEFLVITGPNMGGKSTFIRQAGVISLMAQIGSFVPCDSAVVPVFDSILCRVGAGDSQIKGISTFMSEMLETSAILKSATEHSLVIIDELGRGTSTYDGLGLAYGVGEFLATETRASVLFASHFHELTSLAQEVAHVKNVHVVAHVEAKADSITGKEITLLYKIAPGVCDQSFGIHVAELANFPPEVIKLAQRKADDLEDFSENPSAAAFPVDQLSPDKIAEGTTLVEEMLQKWADKTAELEAGEGVDGAGGEGGDVTMTEGEGEDLLAKELGMLQDCFREYRDKLEETEWTRTVLRQTY